MLTDCKCATGIEAKLDVAANKVVCMECGEEIVVTEFTKAALRNQPGGTIERQEVRVPPDGFLTTCDAKQCNKDFSAELDKETDEVLCPHCGAIKPINAISKGMLASNGIYTGATKRYFQEEGKEARDPADEVKVIEVKANADGKLPTKEDLKEVRQRILEQESLNELDGKYPEQDFDPPETDEEAVEWEENAAVSDDGIGDEELGPDTK